MKSNMSSRYGGPRGEEAGEEDDDGVVETWRYFGYWVVARLLIGDLQDARGRGGGFEQWC
jgi:hypothetical protein